MQAVCDVPSVKPWNATKHLVAVVGTSVPALVLVLGIGLGPGVAHASPPRCPVAKPPPPTDLSDLSIEELLDVKTTVATTRETSVFATPSTVAVIDRETIERYNFRTVSEALQILAGFASWKTTSWSSLPTSRWILQAHYPDKILVMIDGVATWTPVLGEARVDRINIDDVERIEVLRGPGSVLYGSNAYTGAINIVLRCQSQPDTLSGTAYAGAGIKQEMLAGGNMLLDDGDLKMFVGGGGHDEYGDQRTFTDAEGITGSYRDYSAWSDFVLSASYHGHSFLFSAYKSERTKLGKDPTFADGWGDPELSHGYLASYGYAFAPSDRLELRTGTTFDWSQRMFSREAGYDLRTSVIGWRGAAFVKAILSLPGDVTVEVGSDADYRRSQEYWIYQETTQESISQSNLRHRHLYEASAYAQVGGSLGDLGLLAGTRFTHDQVFGNNLSSRLSGVYRFDPGNSLKLIVGQSFRAPTLFELYFLDDKRTTSGEPGLRPETSSSFELAYLTAFHGLFAQALVYHALYDHNIHREPQPIGTPLADGQPSMIEGASKYVNAPRFQATGVEVELTFRGGPFASFASYGYVLGSGGDFNFRYVPAHKAVLGLALSWRGLFGSLVGVYLSPMEGPVADVSGRQDIPGQTRVDANLGYTHYVHGKRVRHVISAKNLTSAHTVVPEYVDLVLRAIPYDPLLRLSYLLTVDF
jgi:outer membrane receptor protein involved in Fe transport